MIEPLVLVAGELRDEGNLKDLLKSFRLSRLLKLGSKHAVCDVRNEGGAAHALWDTT